MAADRRRQLLLVTGGIVAVALVAVVLVAVLGGGDDDGGTPTTDEAALRPVRLTSVDAAAVIGVDGNPAPLSDEDRRGVVAAIEGYLKEATVTPLTTERDDETTTTEAGAVTLADYFTDAAAARLDEDDKIVLNDFHLPFAEDGVDTVSATASLAGIVQDGAAQFVNASIDVVMVAKGDETVTIERSGDLVLRPVDGKWKIAGYRLAVEREFGDRTTTTSEAAFG